MNKAQRVTKWFIAFACIAMGKAAIISSLLFNNDFTIGIIVASVVLLFIGFYKLAYMIDYAIIQNATYRINSNNNYNNYNKRYEKPNYTQNYTQN